MDIKTIAIVFGIIFLLIPANNQTTSYIKIIGLLASGSITLLNSDWAKFVELLNVSIDNFYEWVLMKADGDEAKAINYLAISSFVAMQPIIFVFFYFYRKTRM